jgi:hypothetical protein
MGDEAESNYINKLIYTPWVGKVRGGWSRLAIFYLIVQSLCRKNSKLEPKIKFIHELLRSKVLPSFFLFIPVLSINFYTTKDRIKHHQRKGGYITRKNPVHPP